MRREIWQVTMTLTTEEQTAEMPLGARPLHVGEFGGRPVVFFEVDAEEECQVKQRLRLVWTHKAFPYGGDHIGSVKIGGDFCHIFRSCGLNPKAGGY